MSEIQNSSDQGKKFDYDTDYKDRYSSFVNPVLMLDQLWGKNKPVCRCLFKYN